MPKRPVPALLFALALTLPAFAAAQRPITALLPSSTVLSVEFSSEGFDLSAVEGLLAGLDTTEAERVWEALEATFAAAARQAAEEREAEGGDAENGPGGNDEGSDGPAGDHDGHAEDGHATDLREELARECPALAGALTELEGQGWSAAVGVSVSRFDLTPGVLLALRPESRTASARLLAGSVACFDGRRFGSEGTSAIYLLADGSEMPLMIAEGGGALLASTDLDVLRGALRSAGGSGEPTHADSRIAGFAQQLEPTGLKITLDLAAAADALTLLRGAFVPEGEEQFDRFLTTLRVVNGYSWNAALEGDGLVLSSVSAWDAELAVGEGEEELLALLSCEGCTLAETTLVPGEAVALRTGTYPLRALVAWIDTWLADVNVLTGGGLAAGDPPTLSETLAARFGFDLNAALLDWTDGSWYTATLGVLDTDLNSWLRGLPTLTVVPVTSEEAAREGIRIWLEAGEAAGRMFGALAGAGTAAAMPTLSGAVSVRELTHDGVDYLRIRSGPSFDLGVAVFEGQLVMGTPVGTLLDAIDRRGSGAERPAALVPALEAIDAAPGEVVGYSAMDVSAQLRGLASLVELASGTIATTGWLGFYGLSESETASLPEGFEPPTYDDLLVLTDLAVSALELLADRTGVATGTTTIRDDARWSTWRLPLEGGR